LQISFLDAVYADFREHGACLLAAGRATLGGVDAAHGVRADRDGVSVAHAGEAGDGRGASRAMAGAASRAKTIAGIPDFTDSLLQAVFTP
jgi:hypothetical protein